VKRIDPMLVQASVAKLGIQICVAFPAGLLALALILKKTFYATEGGLLMPETAHWIGYIFIAVALSDIVAAWIVKRRLLSIANLAGKLSRDAKTFAKQVTAAYVPVLAICAAPALYGLVYFFMGGEIETYVLISVICPAGYMAVKPRRAELEALISALFPLEDEEDSDVHL
jgi:hypothetical protein